jgi:hypothetical protein
MARVVVMNLPSPDMKNAVSVRSNLPVESNTVIQKTAGRTLFSNRAKSRLVLSVAFACAVCTGDGDEILA